MDAAGAASPEPALEADAALMLRVGAGDHGALRTLIERWQGPLLNFFYRSVRSMQTSEDLAQTVFIRIYRNAATYVPSARFSTYLFHVARNVLINEHRRRVRKPAEPFDPADFNMENAASGDDASARSCAEIEEAFSRAILELTESQRTAILLHKQQELSYEEIAAVMEASVPLVKSWIFRGRLRLKALLKDL